jgi:hypothetical protein
MRWPSESWRTGWSKQRLEPQHSHQLVASAAIGRRLDAVDVGQQVEAIEHRQVPPELVALAEHHADARHMAYPVLVRHQASHLDPAAGRPQDADRIFTVVDRPPVGADEGQQLAGLEAERDVDQGTDLAPAPAHEAAQRAGETRRAFGDAIGLGQRLDEDLGHGRSAGCRKGREPMGVRRRVKQPRRQAGGSVADAELARPGKNFRSSFHSVLLDRAAP